MNKVYTTFKRPHKWMKGSKFLQELDKEMFKIHLMFKTYPRNSNPSPDKVQMVMIETKRDKCATSESHCKREKNKK